MARVNNLRVSATVAAALAAVCLLALGIVLGSPREAQAIGPNAVRAGFNDNTLSRNDDNSTSVVPMGFSQPLNFFGNDYSQLYVNNNGNVTFDQALGTYTPFDLTSTGRVVIAPFFGDVDTRNTGTAPVTYGYGTSTVDGHDAFGVNWVNVGYYNQHADKLNNFQLVLIDRSDIEPGDFDIEFNYDRIQWETGDASGGSGGLGGASARAGYSNGTGEPGTSFELPGSAVNGAFLDSNPSSGLIHNSLNSTQPGRYVFHVRNGVVEPPNEPPTADAGGPYTVDEGGTVNLDGSLSSDPENGALTYAWDLDNDGQYDDSTDISPSFSAANLDGPSSHTVKVEVTDPAEATDTDEATVNVDNVEPTIESISSNLTQTLTGTSVSFNASTTDPSTADTNAGFTYTWLVDGVANSFTGNPLNHSFSDCGDHSVSATAADKDGGESASVTSDVVSAYEAHFQPPLDEGVYNTVQKGRVVPVKISIGCDGQNLTDLSPAIQLLKGDKSDGTETSSDAVETFSSSAADTTGFMRAVDDGYIYNLQVPSNAVAGDLYTIRVRPFGDSNTGASMYVVLQIRK
jgi:hypothetical protein